MSLRLKRLREKSLLALGVRRGEVPKSYFRPYLPADPVIVEAGAHIGSDTIGLAKLWPRGHVHAFEPIPRVFTKLQARTSQIRNVTCYQVALGKSVATSEMYVSGGHSDGSSSLLAPDGHLKEHPDVTFNAIIRVPVTTLDTWAAATGVSRVDFLWLDLQGVELDALMGGAELLRGVGVVYTEVSLKPLYTSAPLYPEVRAWMEQAGFVVVREELPWPDMGNVMFARPRSIPRGVVRRARSRA